MIIDFDSKNKGGGSKPPVVEALSVTTNGTYNAPSGVYGYNPVEVNVPQREPVLESLSVTDNGTYTPSAGVDGYNSVDVNVPKEHHNVTSKSITSNGTYNSEGDDVWNEVTVNVPEKTFNKASVTKEYTENGQYSIATPDGYDGISDVSVTVNVASSGGGGKFGAGLSGVSFRTHADTIDFSNFDISTITDMNSMFTTCTSLKSLDLSGWNTNNVTDMGYMFNSCNNLKNLNISGFNTSKVTHFGGMFTNCSSLTSLDLSHFDTSKATYMGSMFQGCWNLETLDISSFDIGRYDIKDLSQMFRDCTCLTNLTLGDNFNTLFVENMNYMFNGCSSLTSFDFTLKMNSCLYADHMFADCGNLDHIYFVGWNFQKIKNLDSFLLNCSKLNQIDITGVDWSTATSLTDMFRGCTSLTRIQCQGLKLPDADMSNIGLDSCPLNNYDDLDDLVGLLNALPTTTSNYSFQIGQTNIAKLSDVQKQIATDKGWTLV